MGSERFALWEQACLRETRFAFGLGLVSFLEGVPSLAAVYLVPPHERTTSLNASTMGPTLPNRTLLCRGDGPKGWCTVGGLASDSPATPSCSPGQPLLYLEAFFARASLLRISSRASRGRQSVHPRCLSLGRLMCYLVWMAVSAPRSGHAGYAAIRGWPTPRRGLKMFEKSAAPYSAPPSPGGSRSYRAPNSGGTADQKPIVGGTWCVGMAALTLSSSPPSYVISGIIGVTGFCCAVS